MGDSHRRTAEIQDNHGLVGKRVHEIIEHLKHYHDIELSWSYPILRYSIRISGFVCISRSKVMANHIEDRTPLGAAAKLDDVRAE